MANWSAALGITVDEPVVLSAQAKVPGKAPVLANFPPAHEHSPSASLPSPPPTVDSSPLAVLLRPPLTVEL